MDDSRTQRTLDALADLYLTSPAPSAQGAPVPPPAAGKDPANPSNKSAGNPANKTPAVPDQATSAAPPLRLPPKLRVRPTPFSAAEASASRGPARPWREVRQQRRTQADAVNFEAFDDPSIPLGAHSPMDALDGEPRPTGASPVAGHEEGQQDQPSLKFPREASRSNSFSASGVMGDVAAGMDLPEDQDDLDASDGDDSPRCPSQAVFLGNLPGFAGPWLAQYAQLLTAGRQRVAVVHVSAMAVEVELVSPMGAAAPAKAQPNESLIDLFERLVADADLPLTQWLVHLPMPLDETSLTLGRDLDHWTLLTGSDVAAAVSSCQWLVQMLQDDRRHARRQVGIAVMGSEPSRSQGVLDRMDAVSSDLLPQGVTLRPSRKQMAPVNILAMGHFAPTLELWPELVAYLDSFETAAPTSSRSGTSQPSFAIPDFRRVGPQRQPPRVPETADRALENEWETTAQADRSGDEVDFAQAHATVEKQDAPAMAAPSSHPSSTPSTSAQENLASAPVMDQPLDLSRWAAPGAMALEARCPYKATIQLALDQQGRVHLMAHAGASLSDTVVDLLEARQWAAEHLALLQLTQRQCRFDLGTSPCVHLFTDQSQVAAALVRSVGNTVKLHLLQQAVIGSQGVWMASPLN